MSDMTIESYSICGPIKGVCKQWAIWGNIGTATFPLIYFQRPKYIKNDESWELIVKSVQLDISLKDLLAVEIPKDG